MNIVYLFILAIIVLLVMIYIDNKHIQNTEHFSKAAPKAAPRKSSSSSSYSSNPKQQGILEKVVIESAVRSMVKPSSNNNRASSNKQGASSSNQQGASSSNQQGASSNQQGASSNQQGASSNQQGASSNQQNIEHFSSGVRAYFMVQADDAYQCYYNGQEVSSGNAWNQTYYFNLDNVTANSKFYFGVTNHSSQGSIRIQFNYGGKLHYGDRSNIRCLGKQPEPNGNIIGNLFVGCMQDYYWSRDLPLYAGFMSKDQCMMTAFNQKMPYYGVQAGGQCYMGSSYGRNGYAYNCNMQCAYNSNEICGGVSSNSVYSTAQVANTTEVSPISNVKFDDRTKALWASSGDSSAQGRWLFELTMPSLDKLDFCPNSDYVEFNPAGCLNARTTENCVSSVLSNYNALTQQCGKKYNYADPDLFFMVMNKVFSFVYEIGKNKKNIKPSSNPIQTQIKMTDKTFIDRLKAKSLSPPKQGYSSGSIYLNEFLQNNFRMLGLLKIIGDKVKYPMDHKQLIEGQLVLPDTPMYYALVKEALRYSKKHKGQLGQMFMDCYNATYKFARIIIGTPNIASECSCLGLSIQDSQQCVPC